MRDEADSVAIVESFALKSSMCSFLVDDNSENKKSKSAKKKKKIVAPTKNHNEYDAFLLNKKYLRHSMKKIQSKHHRIGTHKINKISLSCFDDKMFIQNNGYNGLALGY